MNKIIRGDIDNIIANGGIMWERFANSKILVTGASGLIGYYFVAVLLRLNETFLKNCECKVYALVRNWDKAVKRFSDLPHNSNFELLLQDVCEPIDKEFDYIIHAASQASPKYISTDPVGTILPNVIGTNNLLSLAHKSKSKGFLFISGGEVYGTGQLKTPTKETDYGIIDHMAMRSCYAEGKRAGEALCAAWKAQYGVNAVIARLAHTYGPGITRDDGRVFADFAYKIIDGKDMELNSDGSAIRSFCYVAEAVLGMFIVLLQGQSGHAYNICNESACVSIRELAFTLADVFHVGVGLNSSKKDPLSKSCLDSSEARLLGWNPQIGIKDGFTRTIENIKGNV